MTPTPMSCTQWNTRHGIGHRYVALGVKNGDKEEDLDQPFWLSLLFEKIKDTDKQPEGDEIIKELQEE